MIAALVIAAFVLVAFGISQLSAVQASGICQSVCNQGYCCTQNLTGGTVGVIQFAGAIAFAEGYWDQYANVISANRPARDNNPGDLIGTGDAGSDGAYRKYSTPDAGWNALYSQLNLIVAGKSAFYNLDMTIVQMSQHWTEDDPSGAQADWAANVANYLGGTVNDTLRKWMT